MRVTSWLSRKDSSGAPLYKVQGSGPNCRAREWPISNRLRELRADHRPL